MWDPNTGRSKGELAAGSTGAEALLSMVEYNLLALRSYSQIANDLPERLFCKNAGDTGADLDLVTMPTAAHLAAVLELSGNGELEAKL